MIHLIWPYLTTSELTELWSVAATANWVTSYRPSSQWLWPITAHSVQMKWGQLRWDQLRWDEISDMNAPSGWSQRLFSHYEISWITITNWQLCLFLLFSDAASGPSLVIVERFAVWAPDDVTNHFRFRFERRRQWRHTHRLWSTSDQCTSPACNRQCNQTFPYIHFLFYPRPF